MIKPLPSLFFAVLGAAAWAVFDGLLLQQDFLPSWVVGLVVATGTYSGCRSRHRPGRITIAIDARRAWRAGRKWMAAAAVVLCFAAPPPAHADNLLNNALQGIAQKLGSSGDAQSQQQALATAQSLHTDTTCHVCTIFDDLSQSIDQFGGNASGQIASASVSVWKGFLTIYFLWAFLDMMLMGVSTQKWKKLLFNMLFGIGIYAFINKSTGGAGGLFMADVYQPTVKICSQLGSAMIAQIGGGSSSAGASTPLGQLFGAGENSLMSMTYLGWSIITAPGPLSFIFIVANLFFGLLLMAVYLLVLLIYAAHVAESMVIMMYINCLAPAFIMAFYFKPTRHLAIGAVKKYVFSGLLLIFSAIGIGVTILLANKYFTGLYNDSSQFGAAIVYDNNYWLAAIWGFLSIITQKKATDVAGQIAGATSGQSGFGAAMTGLIAGAASTLAPAAGKMAGAAVGASINPIGATVSAAKSLGSTAKDWVSRAKKRM